MYITDSVSKGFSIAVRSWGVVFILFLVGVLFNFASGYLTAGFTPTTGTGQVLRVMLPLILLFALVGFYTQGGSLGYVRDSLKGGEAGLGSFFAYGGKYFVRLLLVGLFNFSVFLAFVLLLAVVGIPFYPLVKEIASKGAAAVPPYQLSLYMLLVVFLLTIFLYILALLSLASYVVVAREGRVMESIRESVGLVRKNLWDLVAFSLTIVLISLYVSLVLGFVTYAFGGGAPTREIKTTAGIAQVAAAVIGNFVYAFLGFFAAGGFMSFYLKLSSDNPNTPGAS